MAYKWVVLLNIVIMITYAIVAIHFEKWWIMLFSAISLFSYKTGDESNNG